MCNNKSNNIILVATSISLWIFNNLSSDAINYLFNLFQTIGQNLSSMIALDVIPTSDNNNNNCQK